VGPQFPNHCTTRQGQSQVQTTVNDVISLTPTAAQKQSAPNSFESGRESACLARFSCVLCWLHRCIRFLQAVIQFPWHVVFNDELLSAFRACALAKLDRIHHGRKDERGFAVWAVDRNFGEWKFDGSFCAGHGGYLCKVPGHASRPDSFEQLCDKFLPRFIHAIRNKKD
jgi:hypothetical protein